MRRNDFQYYVWYFGKCPNFDQTCDFGPLMYCRNTLKIQEIPKHFSKSRIQLSKFANKSPISNWWSILLHSTSRPGDLCSRDSSYPEARQTREAIGSFTQKKAKQWPIKFEWFVKCLMSFHEFWNFGPIPNYFQEYEENELISKHIMFINLIMLDFNSFWFLRKRRAPEIMKIRVIISWKSWIWDKYLPENMKWIFGNMGPISTRKHEMELLVIRE